MQRNQFCENRVGSIHIGSVRSGLTIANAADDEVWYSFIQCVTNFHASGQVTVVLHRRALLLGTVNNPQPNAVNMDSASLFRQINIVTEVDVNRYTDTMRIAQLANSNHKRRGAAIRSSPASYEFDPYSHCRQLGKIVPSRPVQ